MGGGITAGAFPDEELTQVDKLLDDDRFLAPFRERFSTRIGAVPGLALFSAGSVLLLLPCLTPNVIIRIHTEFVAMVGSSEASPQKAPSLATG